MVLVVSTPGFQPVGMGSSPITRSSHIPDSYSRLSDPGQPSSRVRSTMDSASRYGREGYRFESCRAYSLNPLRHPLRQPLRQPSDNPPTSPPTTHLTTSVHPVLHDA